MSKYTFYKNRPYEFMDLGKWFIFGFMIVLIHCVRNPEPTEPKETPHIWQGKGWIDSLNTFKADPHCRN